MEPAMTKIYVTIRNVYGNDTIYPACDKSRLLAELAGHKTLTRADLRTIRELGYEVAESPFDARKASVLASGWSADTARQRVGGTFGS
jgi:hypothetical protein